MRKDQKRRASPYRPLADALGALFGPLVEVAIHDLATDSLAYIVRPLSPREIGEPSNLRELGLPNGDGVIGPYEKTNWDGRRLKSVSVMLPGQPATMLCINMDVSRFEALRDTLGMILQPMIDTAGGEAGPLLRTDWHEAMNRHIAAWCQERGADARKLDRDGRRALIRSILDVGGFDAPRAAPYVARLLNLSRATVYNEIASIRKEARAS